MTYRLAKSKILRCARCGTSLVLPPDGANVLAATCFECSADNPDELRASFPRAQRRLAAA